MLTYEIQDGKIYPVFKCAFCGETIVLGALVLFGRNQVEIVHNQCWLSYVDEHSDRVHWPRCSLGELLDFLRENSEYGKTAYVTQDA